jgi:hypothetical protein
LLRGDVDHLGVNVIVYASGFDLFIMSASKTSSTSEFEQDRRIGREEVDEPTGLNLHKAASDVTAAALFALELIQVRRELSWC